MQGKTIKELEKEFHLKIDNYSGSAEMKSATKEFEEQQFVTVEQANFWCELNSKHCREATQLSMQYKNLLETLIEILEGLSEKLPIAKKITQYDSETKEDWIIEVPDQYEYSRFFDWVDANLARWQGILSPVPHKQVKKDE